jgi:hypothetical protein
MDLVSPSSGLIFWQILGFAGLAFMFYILFLVVKYLKTGIKKNLESK